MLEQSFDLVTQFTVFGSLLDNQLRLVAAEMHRVLKPGCLILWYDLQLFSKCQAFSSCALFLDLQS
jgi:hypothetical protein